VREQQRRPAGALEHAGNLARRARPEPDAGDVGRSFLMVTDVR
jgi:hypothetical protein